MSQQFTDNIHTESPIIMNNRISEKRITAVITKIWWERILLHMNVHVQCSHELDAGDLDFYLVTEFYKTNAKCKAEKISDKYWHIVVNITNPGGYLRCLPTAAYKLYICHNLDILCRAEVSQEIAANIGEYSRSFLHNGASSLYAVNAILSEADEGLYPVFEVSDNKKVGLFAFTTGSEEIKKENCLVRLLSKTKIIIKKKLKLKNKVRWAYKKWANQYRNAKKKTVLFMSEQNESMTGNLEAVYRRMHERHLDEQFKITTSFRSAVAKKDEYKAGSWINTINKIARADYIFVDDHCPVFDWLKIDSKTEVIQLWHAGAGYKGVGYSRWGHKGCPAPFSCHRQYTWCITPSDNIGYFFSEQFGINDEQIIPTGMPRMDEYLDEEYRAKKTEELKHLYPICINKKVILFAPTYRGTNKALAHYPYNLIDFEKLYEFCGDEYVVLFKMHPWVQKPVPIDRKYQDRMLDVGDYKNINDLFYITDIYISDYSSGIFEYSLMKRPALFYAFDELQYAYTRGFHRDYRESTPGKVCNSFDEIILALKEHDFEFEKMDAYIKHHFDYFDTGASDRVIDWFLLGKMPKEYLDRMGKRKYETNVLRLMDFSSLR